MGIKIIFRTIINRRKRQEPVTVERRRRIRTREAEHTLRQSIERLSNAIRMKRPDIMEFGTATVTFATFSEVCNYRVPGLNIRLCRHKKHENAKDALAPCNERLCPFMRGAT